MKEFHLHTTIPQGEVRHFGAKYLLFLENTILANAMFCKYFLRFSFSPYKR
jgi:hypothetical protein